MRCTVVILSLLLPATAVAESDLDRDCAAVAAVENATCEATPPRSPDLRTPVTAPSLPEPAAPLGRKSEAGAISLSIGVTAGGVAALAIAASAHANDTFRTRLAIAGIGLLLVGPTAGHIYAGNAWNRGLQLRLGSLAVATTGIALAWRACAPFEGCTQEEHDQSKRFGALGLVGALGYSVAMFYEIGSAGSAVRKYNLRLVPTGTGVGAVGRF